MPDSVLNWIYLLKTIKADPYSFFGSQIQETITILQNNDDFSNFVNGLKAGINGAFNLLET